MSQSHIPVHYCLRLRLAPARFALKAATIAKARGGGKACGAWTARCHTHDNYETSPSVYQAKDCGLLSCRAGGGLARVTDMLTAVLT